MLGFRHEAVLPQCLDHVLFTELPQESHILIGELLLSAGRWHQKLQESLELLRIFAWQLDLAALLLLHVMCQHLVEDRGRRHQRRRGQGIHTEHRAVLEADGDVRQQQLSSRSSRSSRSSLALALHCGARGARAGHGGDPLPPLRPDPGGQRLG